MSKNGLSMACDYFVPVYMLTDIVHSPQKESRCKICRLFHQQTRDFATDWV